MQQNGMPIAPAQYWAELSRGQVKPVFGYLADRISKPWLMPIDTFLAGLGMAFTGLTANCKSRSFINARGFLSDKESWFFVFRTVSV